MCQQGDIPPPVGGNHFRAEKQDASGIKGPQNEDDHRFERPISPAIATIVLEIPGEKMLGHLEEEGAASSSGQGVREGNRGIRNDLVDRGEP